MGTTFKEEIKNYLELVPDSNNIAEHTAVDTKNVQHKCFMYFICDTFLYVAQKYEVSLKKIKK